MKKVKILIVCFKNEISDEEVEWFRAAVDVTNHSLSGGCEYAYPVVQYKRIKGKAAIVCVGEGEKQDRVIRFFQKCPQEIRLGSRVVNLEVESVEAHQNLVQVWQDMFDYRIRKWLPLNEENYKRYKATEGLKEQVALLESILTGNLRSFAKGLGLDYELRQKIVCTITSLGDSYLIHHFDGVRMTAFDADFKTNITLPNCIGVGKGVSIGRGTVTMKRNKKTTTKTDE